MRNTPCSEEILFLFIALKAHFLGIGPGGEVEGTKSCRIQGESLHQYIIRPSVHLSVRMSPLKAPQRLAQASQKWMDGRTDGRMRRTDEMDGRTDSPCILQDFVPSGSLRGRCPAYTIATIIKYQSRARVPMTISCLWATGCFLLCLLLTFCRARRRQKPVELNP